MMAAAGPLAAHIHPGRAMFQVLISPGTAGTDDFVLQLMPAEGNLLAVKAATLVRSLPGSGGRAAGAQGDAWCRRLLARGRRAASGNGPLAPARRGGHGVPDDRPGRRYRIAVTPEGGFSLVPCFVTYLPYSRP
jgi:hypothetical protein